MKDVREEKILAPILAIAVIVLVIFTSGILVIRSPFISTSSVSNVLGGKWTINNFSSGNNTLSEILSDSQGDMLIIIKYTFPSEAQAQNYFQTNALNETISYYNYLISYYTHGLSESVYILNGNSVYYISYVATNTTSLPSINQLINIIR
ncbi:MAG: hypothetical protein QXP09_14060 [Saccharolobus sp.]|uniref:hypothetical protein n=1 Tax=Saccharolobus sp. TaxID=2100761 RepID=UPI003168A301